MNMALYTKGNMSARPMSVSSKAF